MRIEKGLYLICGELLKYPIQIFLIFFSTYNSNNSKI